MKDRVTIVYLCWIYGKRNCQVRICIALSSTDDSEISDFNVPIHLPFSMLRTEWNWIARESEKKCNLLEMISMQKLKFVFHKNSKKIFHSRPLTNIWYPIENRCIVSTFIWQARKKCSHFLQHFLYSISYRLRFQFFIASKCTLKDIYVERQKSNECDSIELKLCQKMWIERIRK